MATVCSTPYKVTSSISCPPRIRRWHLQDRLLRLLRFIEVLHLRHRGRTDKHGRARCKKCAGQWSGDWLNYMTTARIDALRKVMYGGDRLDRHGHAATRCSSAPMIPQDAHSWGKAYERVARMATTSPSTRRCPPTDRQSRHFFANTTLRWTDSAGVLRDRVTTAARRPVIQGCTTHLELGEQGAARG